MNGPDPVVSLYMALALPPRREGSGACGREAHAPVCGGGVGEGEGSEAVPKHRRPAVTQHIVYYDCLQER